MIAQMVTVVVPDEETVSELWELQAEAYGDSRSNMLWYAHLDVDCDEAMLETLEARYEEAVEDDSFYDGTGSWYSSRWDLRSDLHPCHGAHHLLQADFRGLRGQGPL